MWCDYTRNSQEFTIRFILWRKKTVKMKKEKRKESQTEKKRKEKTFICYQMRFVLFFCLSSVSMWLGRSVRSDPMAIAVICDLYMISFRFHLHLWCLLSFPMPTEKAYIYLCVFGERSIIYICEMRWLIHLTKSTDITLFFCAVKKRSASVTYLLASFIWVYYINWLIGFSFGFSHPCVSMIGVTHQDCAERKELERKKKNSWKKRKKEKKKSLSLFWFDFGDINRVARSRTRDSRLTSDVSSLCPC